MIEPSRGELVVVARLSNVLILVIALVVMADLGSIQTAWFISLLFGAGMGSVLVMRWLWERINVCSEYAAMAVSLITAPILVVTVEGTLSVLPDTSRALRLTMAVPTEGHARRRREAPAASQAAE